VKASPSAATAGGCSASATKVTQLRNNYEKGATGVFNGTVGVVTGMSPEDHKMTVLTDEDESVDYAFDELDELAHAYAVTIHRSQGSEYPAVVIPLTMGSYPLTSGCGTRTRYPRESLTTRSVPRSGSCTREWAAFRS
jgi:exodeoxyribonuclease V alpha subunit